MGEIEWAMWANEQALVSLSILLLGAIIGVAATFNNWQFAAFCIPAAVLLIILEYPRSKRSRGNTIERRFQNVLTPVVDKLSPVSTNYYVRFIVHLLVSVPCCFLLPTLMGGVSLIVTSIIYLVAALKGEEWKPVRKNKAPSQAAAKTVTSLPPSNPPPRAPKRNEGEINQAVNQV